MNAKEELLRLTEGEQIEALVINSVIGWGDDKAIPEFYPKENLNEGLKKLDFEFDSGYGGEEGYRIFAWTPTKVIIKTVYDGSEAYESIPRNPSVVLPDAYGGG